MLVGSIPTRNYKIKSNDIHSLACYMNDLVRMLQKTPLFFSIYKESKLLTSIQPEDKRLGSWIYFCFNKVVEKSFMLHIIIIHTYITWKLLKANMGLSRKPCNLVRMRRIWVNFHEQAQLKHKCSHYCHGLPEWMVHDH